MGTPEISLQWGHVLSDMETLWEMLKKKHGSELQWGHVLSDMETIIFLTPRKWSLLTLQWGHVLSDMETSSTAT